VKLRIFPEAAGGAGPEGGAQMARSVKDLEGGILVVSQFTLHGSVRKGTRPSFNEAAPPALAIPLYEGFIVHLQTALGRSVQTGKFGAMMKISLVNDGPVTIVIDTKTRD
jgi:D-tyrosyl-tRNA(Tyr) deacylase